MNEHARASEQGFAFFFLLFFGCGRFFKLALFLLFFV